MPPQAPSVTRSGRGRCSKAKTSSAAVAGGSDATLAEETLISAARGPVVPNLNHTQTTGVRTTGVLSFAGPIFTLLCLLGVLVYCDPHIHIPDQASEPATLSREDTTAALDGLVLWIHSHLLWKKQVSEVETEIETLDRMQIFGDSDSARKDFDCICPQSPACVNKAECDTDHGKDAGRMRDPVRLRLLASLLNIPAFWNFVRQVFDHGYEATMGHPWWFAALTFCAAWKATELLVHVGKTGGRYVLEIASRITRTYQSNERFVAMDLDDESETARKEAKKNLLLHIRVTGKGGNVG